MLPFSTVFSDAQVLPFSIMIYKRSDPRKVVDLSTPMDREMCASRPRKEEVSPEDRRSLGHG
ncbi:MAG TPA: hypothetical protein VI462_15535, partial [Acidimicrobiia bacterium]